CDSCFMDSQSRFASSVSPLSIASIARSIVGRDISFSSSSVNQRSPISLLPSTGTSLSPLVVPGPGDVELAADVLLGPRRTLVDPVVERAGADPLGELRGGCTRVVDLLAEQLAEEGQVLVVGLVTGADLAGDDGADVRRDEHSEALFAGHLRAQLREQVLGDRVEQLG